MNIICLSLDLIFVADTPAIIIFPGDQTILENSNVTFLCLGVGRPIPTPSWMFKGDTIDFTDSRYSLGEVGLYLGSLTITELEYSDRGEYTCVYTNDNGNDTTSATLTVQGTILYTPQVY